MAAGDINDPLSNIPNIVVVDQSAATAAPGAGYGRLEVVNGVLGLRVGSGAWFALLDVASPEQVHAVTEKATGVAADVALIEDSEDSWAKKRVPLSGLPAGAPTLPAPVDWSGTLTLTQSGAVTATVTECRYQLIGKLCCLYVKLLFTSAGTGNNPIELGGVPAAAQPSEASPLQGAGSFLYFDVGTAYYTGSVAFVDLDKLRFFCHNTGAWLGQTPNFAVANGDTLGFTACYRIA